MAMTPKLWSISGLAVELDVDRRTVAAALRDVPADGKVGAHDAWRMSTAVEALGLGRKARGVVEAPEGEMSLDEALRRKAAAQARLAEIEADLQEGRCVLVEESARQVAGEYAIVRNSVLALPSRVASRLVGLTKPQQIHSIIYDEVVLILEALSADGGAPTNRQARRAAKATKKGTR